jgi:hypothetical protein
MRNIQYSGVQVRAMAVVTLAIGRRAYNTHRTTERLSKQQDWQPSVNLTLRGN